MILYRSRSEAIQASSAPRSGASTGLPVGALGAMRAVVLCTAALLPFERWTSQMAVDIDSAQPWGKQVLLAVGQIFPTRDIFGVQDAVFAAEILLHKRAAR